MPSTWNSEHDAQLFHLTVEQFKVQGKDLVAGWEKKYGKAKAPTASAIDQHIGQLRKKHKFKTPTKTLNALPAGANTSNTCTPSKSIISRPKTPKTPASGSKRKRGSDSDAEMSDEDISEAPTSKQELANLPRRKSTPRRGKTPRVYTEAESSDEEENEEVVGGADEMRAPVTTEENPFQARGNHALRKEIDEVINCDGTDEREPKSRATAAEADAAATKKRFMTEKTGDESDGSDFSPFD